MEFEKTELGQCIMKRNKLQADLAAIRKECAHEKQKVFNLNTHLAASKKRVAELEKDKPAICAYCYKKFLNHEENLEKITDHVLTCEKNPLVARITSLEGASEKTQKMKRIDIKRVFGSSNRASCEWNQRRIIAEGINAIMDFLEQAISRGKEQEHGS